MTRARLVSLLVAIAVLAALTGASGGCESKGTCKPGDTRAAKGHTDVCNSDGKWTPYVKPTVRPR